MKSKETLFSKNNYDMQLEEVLDNKEFNDEAKSLILSVLYKIEESYKDYAKVKLNVKLKNEIIEEIINILKYKCDKILILNPTMFSPQNIMKKNAIDKASIYRAHFLIQSKKLFNNLFNLSCFTNSAS